ncbi:MAG: 3-dehydro-L-gulonate 2-dehydrogenase [Bacteroidales bacterium]
MIELVPAEQMKSEFIRILKKYGFSEEKADRCAGIFTINSLEGVYSHGYNRFPKFVDNIRKGFVIPDASPSLAKSAGSIEQWNGNLGPGPLNAIFATERAMELAVKNGIGLIALANTNHWMRGGTYGWEAARKGFVFIGWTNTEANMPAWGAKDFRLGNNPLVIAIPFGKEAIVLDFAMSLFSYGKLEVYQLGEKLLPFPGGYNDRGELTADPGEILLTRRSLPIGYWKGSGLSLLLDILAAVLSGGLSTHEISRKETEYSLSQVFIAISLNNLAASGAIENAVQNIINDLKGSVPVEPLTEIRYPGENIVKVREENRKNGIPVNKEVWEKIKLL